MKKEFVHIHIGTSQFRNSHWLEVPVCYDGVERVRVRHAKQPYYGIQRRGRRPAARRGQLPDHLRLREPLHALEVLRHELHATVSGALSPRLLVEHPVAEAHNAHSSRLQHPQDLRERLTRSTKTSSSMRLR
jgi:hypothetical protein